MKLVSAREANQSFSHILGQAEAGEERPTIWTMSARPCGLAPSTASDSGTR
jgi:antitoxin (DNA-binding transcriptional repressor) of toxin-antitoxin stability system